MRSSLPIILLATLAALLASLVGCNTSGKPALETDSDPSVDHLGALIEANVEFRKPLGIELFSHIQSATSETLTAMGYLEPTHARKPRFSLTEKGGTRGFRKIEFETGVPFYAVPLARRELVAVTRIVEAPYAARDVEFSFRSVPNELGRELLESGSDLRLLHDDTARSGRARVARYEDGWRIQYLSLSNPSSRNEARSSS